MSIPNTLEEFKENLVCEPFAETRHFQASNWKFNGQELFHERYYVKSFPKRNENTLAELNFRANEKTHSSYWAGYFSDKDDALKAAKEYNANIDENPYGPGYYLIFVEFDDVVRFCFDFLNESLEDLLIIQ